ncbi:DUF1669 domain-containing protein [Nostoc sp. FACHB-973]|nr:DUF1669 domain-containing protein [Nostoc sp. FACHB-973]
MANLSSLEKAKLERILGMASGYVLRYSDNTFKNLIIETTNIDIYENDKYTTFGTSKAKRLRSFWDQESNHIVGRLLLALLEQYKFENSQNSFYTKTEDEQSLFDQCLKISYRLMNDTDIEDSINQNIDICFEKIQNSIIAQIEQAKFTIWIAVAWFTDKQIFEKLILKRNEGLNIQLIISSDEINEKSGLNYMEFETYKLPKIGKYENIMHNKFCIIDLNKVIHGSYNWTNKAKFNFETITILYGRQEAEKFAEQFIKLKIIALDYS